MAAISAEFCDLPEELQLCCAAALDITSAGRFGQASRACWRLVDGQLVAAKAERDRAVLKKISSRWCETLAATWRVADGPSLVGFSDGGAQFYKCSGMPDKECRVGTAYTNLARHLASRAPSLPRTGVWSPLARATTRLRGRLLQPRCRERLHRRAGCAAATRHGPVDRVCRRTL